MCRDVPVATHCYFQHVASGITVRCVLRAGIVFLLDDMEGSLMLDSTQLLSLLSVVPLLASALKILYTDGMDVLGGIRNEIRSIRMDMRYTFLGRVENLPSYNPSPQQQVTPMRLEGYEPVPTTRQWLLESFDLKL